LLGAALPECEIALLSGETHVTTHLRDEAELFGLLERLRDLGAMLVSVSCSSRAPPRRIRRSAIGS
jgi:hypothetical protein